MTFVKQVLAGKPSQVWTIGAAATVFEALKLMADKNVGALPVVERDDLVGIFSERDYARKIILKGRLSRVTRVAEVMSSPVISVTPGDTLETCMELMTGRRVRHLPVMEGGRLVGLISSGDVLKSIIDDQRVLIRDLENYITSTPS